MTKTEFRNSAIYKKYMERIKGYSKGYNFTIPYYKMTRPQINAINVILNDAVKAKIIDSMSFGINLEGEITEETYMRL